MKSKEEYYEMFDKPKHTSSQDRPTVRGTVVLLTFVGIFNVIMAYFNIVQINQFINDPRYTIPSWFLPLNYAFIILGIMSIVAAVLIARYKRIGLILGAIIIVINLAASLIALIVISANPGLCGTVLQIAALYYIYEYLTKEPQSTYFT
jgi:hypothetical protein